jgi:hypothetical protein
MAFERKAREYNEKITKKQPVNFLDPFWAVFEDLSSPYLLLWPIQEERTVAT